METINTIQCPHCKALMDPWEYVDTGDMDGDFKMNCEECGKNFRVQFNTEVKFTTEM